MFSVAAVVAITASCFGKHHAELPVRAVAAVPVSGHPELEPVSLSPVRIWLVRSFRFQHPGGLGDPLLRQQPLTVPDSTLQVQQPEPGDRIRGRVEPGVSDIATIRVLLPADLTDAQRVEQPRAQVCGEGSGRSTAG